MRDAGLVGAVEKVLLQGRALLGSLDAEVYKWKDTQGCEASIGMHYRHVLEHFQCVLEGLESSRIDYDLRLRSPELEGSVDAAVLATDSLIEQFRSLPTDTLLRECKVRYSINDDENGAEEVGSTFAREIMFCVGHATHHYALLKPLCAQVGVHVPHEFGIAPSTLKHMQTLERG